MRPGAPPKRSRYVYTGPGEVSSLIADPLGTLVIPCFCIFFKKLEHIMRHRQSFTSDQMFHTHTHIYKLTSKFGELAGVRCHSAVTCPWFWNASSADQTRGGWWECLVWGWYGKSCHRHAPQLAKWRQCGGIRRLSCFLDLGSPGLLATQAANSCHMIGL